MAQQPQVPVTQRAYTLRLGRVPGECAACQADVCDCWREALWATHEAVNKGAKAFGDWLLTLRGGLFHTLADMDVPAKGKKKPARKPTDEERRDRRVLLALSWLSVEDEHGAPTGEGLHVATGKDAGNKRSKAVLTALREILRSRGVKEKEIEGWLADCGPSLEASIREDAVWVNRSRAFDEASRRWSSLNREDARAVLARFFGETSEYLNLPVTHNGDDEAPVAAGSDQEVEIRNIARCWISFNFGTGEKSDNAVIADQLATLARMQLDRFAGARGIDLAAAIGKKVNADVSDELDTTLNSIRAAVGWKTGRPSKGRLAIETTCRKKCLGKADLEALVTKPRIRSKALDGVCLPG